MKFTGAKFAAPFLEQYFDNDSPLPRVLERQLEGSDLDGFVYANTGTEDFNTVSEAAESKAGGRYCESDANFATSLVLSTGVDNVVRCLLRAGEGEGGGHSSLSHDFWFVVSRIKGKGCCSAGESETSDNIIATLKAAPHHADR